MASIGFSRRRLLGASVAGVATAAAPRLIRSAHAQGTITFPTLGPTTGAYGYAGRLVRDGSSLAIGMRDGEILGQKINHIWRDDEGKASSGVRRLTEAIATEDVKVFNGNYSSAVGLAESEVAQRRKVLQYSAGGSEDFTGSRCSRYTFHWSANAYTALKAVMDYVAAKMPEAKRWYTITADYVFGQSLLKYAEVVGKDKGIEIVGNDFHPLGERQYTQYLTKAINAQPDVLCLLNGGTDAVTSLRQFHGYGMEDMQVVVPWGIELDQMRELTAQMLQGVVIGSNYYHTIDTGLNQEFVAAYGERFGIPPVYASAYGYDSFRTVLMAMEQAGTTDIQEVVKTLEGMEYESILGPSRIDPNTHQTVRPYYVVRGKPEAEMRSENDFADIVHVGSDPQPAELNECEDLGPV
jgi:branched-chain amino acid transport system substrate-binding protein